MSGSHKKFPKAVWVQLGLAALVGAGYLFSDKPAVNAVVEKVTKPIVIAAAKILAPIGKVEIKEEGNGGSATRSGEEVYASTCGTCHNSGIAGAPKLDDKTSWETRLSGGFSALVASSITGKGGMPARGGNPEITDSEMELAVSHMIKQAGIELVASSAAMTTPAVTNESMEVEVKTTTPSEAEEKSAMESKAKETKDAVVKKLVAVNTATMDSIATSAATVSATTETDHSAGEAIYKNSCFACHDSGVANSPKIGDKVAWTARIAMGDDTLYKSAIKGKGAMPAKGGNTSISDADVKAAVDYMTANSM